MAFDHAPLGVSQVRTRHRGVVYRSRLAAQWAAFLDALRIVHVYEAETFALSPGVYFTPAFWLPQLKTWLDVRPAGEAREADRWKIELFARQHPEARVWITSGAPRPGDWHIEQFCTPLEPSPRTKSAFPAASTSSSSSSSNNSNSNNNNSAHSGNARPIARGLLLADAGRPADRVWICGTNDEASEHLIFDAVDIGRPNHAPGFGGSRPADPNSDAIMRIAYAHAERAGGGEDDSWAPLGATLRRKADELRGRGFSGPTAH